MQVQQLAKERKAEIELAKLKREQAEAQKDLQEKVKLVQREKEQINQRREALEKQKNDELEKKDFMKIIRSTQDNIDKIYDKGQTQLE